MQANIFKIKKSSRQDGPGLRTVIYFKGCPLRCAWCSSPQTQQNPTQFFWDSKRCLFCRLCETNCPTGSLHFENNKLIFSPENCTTCRICVNQCPSRMLHAVGKMMELDEVMDIILEEKELYGEDGGVTLSGGDPLLQSEFAAALLKECHKHGIHTITETTGAGKTLAFARLISNTDQLLFNIKHYSEKKHIHYTGVATHSILENLDFAIAAGLPVTVQITITPGINDALSDAQRFASLLAVHRVKNVMLMPFEKIGVNKYEDFELPPA